MTSLTLRQRFLRAPTQFLTAVSDGPPALEIFETDWTQLRIDLEHDLNASNIPHEDLMIAQTASLQIKSLSSAFSELQQTTSKLTSSLYDQVGDMLSKMSIASTSSRHSLPSVSNHPPYIKKAFDWLLGNLHDPYPSFKSKKEIMDDAGCSLRVLTDWFKSMRRCVGWTEVCKKHFAGSRTRTREAAYLVFVSHSLDTLSGDVVADFLAVQSNLQNMFLDEHGANVHNVLSSTLLNMSPPPSPYSRPHSSLSQHSTTPSLFHSTSEESEEDDSFPDIPTNIYSVPTSHRQKATFATFDTPLEASWVSIPEASEFIIPEDYTFSSIEAGIFEIPSLEPYSQNVYESSSTMQGSGNRDTDTVSAHDTLPCKSKRKRRLSDVGMETTRKRPHIPIPIRAVSDPLPCNSASTSFDVEEILAEWLKEDFSSVFEIPGAVTTESPTPDLSWHGTDVVQTSDRNDNLESCDQWSSLVSDGDSFSRSSMTRVSITDAISHSSPEDIWVPLFNVPDPVLEPEAVTVASFSHMHPSIIPNSARYWSDDVPPRDGCFIFS